MSDVLTVKLLFQVRGVAAICFYELVIEHSTSFSSSHDGGVILNMYEYRCISQVAKNLLMFRNNIKFCKERRAAL